MGCKTSGEVCEGFSGVNDGHCFAHRPGSGTTFEYEEYPAAGWRGGSYNIPEREANAVMHDSVTICAQEQAVNGSTCGKVVKVSGCSSGAGACSTYYDYHPNELSFDWQLSDTWISFLYDTSDDAGTAGTPCFYLETETRGTVVAPGAGSQTPASNTGESGIRCIPCTNFYCTANKTNLRYTADEDLTGDPDCPHPTLFGFGTDSTKIAFEYDTLSTQVPNGVTDFSFSTDGSTYTDVWDQGLGEGLAYESSQNPWQAGDEEFADFEIFELETGNTKTGLRIKVYIEPIFDDSGANVVFSGTRWTVSELLSPGTGYAVNDTYDLEYEYEHPDETTTTLSVTLKVTAVGNVSVVAGQTGFDVLRPGDTINGHTITRTFHTDIDNFPYHVAYLDATGSNFTKDTQYTSDRDHEITVKAGFGIPDRAILVGLYEFLDKSVQYVTADLDRNSPDTFASIEQPDVTVTVSNGRVTGATIVDGGANWNTLGRDPELVITAPRVDSGTPAEVKGTFSGGQLTSIQITNQGSGYSSTSPPNVWIRNIFRNKTEKITNASFRDDAVGDFQGYLKAFPEGNVSATAEDLNNIKESIDSIQKEQTLQTPQPPITIKTDPKRRRIEQLPQRLYNKETIDGLRPLFRPQYDVGYIDGSPLDRKFKSYIKQEKINDEIRQQKLLDDLSQDQVPEYSNNPESLVETVQGTLKDLPYASTYTKYIMRQYRADPRSDLRISVSLSCEPVDTGCSHFTCATPTLSTGSSSSETDPETGDVTTTTTSYTMSGLLGGGCQSWTASGEMRIFNNLTGAATRVSEAAEAYGNPYDP